MARSGFWNKKKVSEAKHYPTGVRRYCDKHGVTFVSYQNYCYRHDISAQSLVTDRRGNSQWTFDLFQQALKAPSVAKFCNDNGLSQSMFYNYKKYGFPSQKVKKKDLASNVEVVSDTVSEPMELTTSDIDSIFDVIDEPANTEPIDTVVSEVKSMNESIKTKKPNGFWTLDLINTAKNYEGGIHKFCEDYGVTIGAFRKACERFGVSAAVKRNPESKRNSTSSVKSRNYKAHFWSPEKIAEAKSYPGGIEKFCSDNGVTLKAYKMACYTRGIDHHIDTEHSSESAEDTNQSVPKTTETTVDKFCFSDYLEPRDTYITIKYKDGKVKEVNAKNEFFLMLSGNNDIDEICFNGSGTISFI